MLKPLLTVNARRYRGARLDPYSACVSGLKLRAGPSCFVNKIKTEVGPYNLADLRNFGGRSVEGQLAVILQSLGWSRGHGKNARFDDNGREEVNMLDYLEGQRLRWLIDAVVGMFPTEEDITNW
jgi:hypothetical protein